MMTDKQKYFALMSEVCELLKPADINAPVRAGYDVPANLLDQARIGRRPVLRDLVAIVTHAHPDFQIPAHLRPAA